MQKAAIYLRVSANARIRPGLDAGYEQNPEVQEQPLRQLASQRGWKIHRIYTDRASGAADDRPGLKALMQDARRGEFSVVLVWRFDRFARSVEQLVTALAEFRTLGIDFVSHQEALDTSVPMGKAMFTIIAAMAELERNVIRERVRSGLEYARLAHTDLQGPRAPRQLRFIAPTAELPARVGGIVPEWSPASRARRIFGRQQIRLLNDVLSPIRRGPELIHLSPRCPPDHLGGSLCTIELDYHYDVLARARADQSGAALDTPDLDCPMADVHVIQPARTDVQF